MYSTVRARIAIHCVSIYVAADSTRIESTYWSGVCVTTPTEAGVARTIRPVFVPSPPASAASERPAAVVVDNELSWRWPAHLPLPWKRHHHVMSRQQASELICERPTAATESIQTNSQYLLLTYLLTYLLTNWTLIFHSPFPQSTTTLCLKKGPNFETV